jgi:hypothetical protein
VAGGFDGSLACVRVGTLPHPANAPRTRIAPASSSVEIAQPRSVRIAGRLSFVISVNKHRSWTPGLREANLLIYYVNGRQPGSRSAPTRIPPQTNFLALHQGIAVI